jgi:hypothetical protein
VTTSEVDEKGSPINGALLEISTSKVPRVPAAANPGVQALSDSGGVASLRWQPEGFRKYRIEAKGYLPTIIEARVAAGSITNLGRVQLIPARGEILLKKVGDWGPKIYFDVEMRPVRSGRSGLNDGRQGKPSLVFHWRGLVPEYKYLFQINCYILDSRGSKNIIGGISRVQRELGAFPSDSSEPTVIEMNLEDLRISRLPR